MSSLEKIKYWRKRNVDELEEKQPERIYRVNTQNPTRLGGQTLPKFKRPLSSSRVSRSSQKNNVNRQQHNFSNMKLYKKLNHQLEQIKETLKQSLVSVGHRKQKNTNKKRERIVTELTEHDLKSKPQHTHKYYNVLEQIAEIRTKNRKNHLKEPQPFSKQSVKVSSSSLQEKTLFYGVDYIDRIQFKIKIKLSKTHYYLFAKSSHIKIMIEMNYSDYMKLNLGELKGNPCNIFGHIVIQGQKLQLLLKSGSGKESIPSFKSYLGYY